MKQDMFASAKTLAGGRLRRPIFGFTLACFIALAALPADAVIAQEPDATSDSQGIAAVVNDQIISSYDLEQRVKLVMVSSGIPNTAENVSRIRGQVLRSLVDEYLQRQEARRLNVNIERTELDSALERIAQRSNMTVEQIDEFLKEGGVSRTALETQISSEMAWQRVVQQQFGPLVTVGQGEVDEVLRRLEEEADQPRYLVSEILITFDGPVHAEEISAGTQRLVEQMREGAPFEAVARQFSQSASAANGGDIGWVHASQLPDGVGDVVTNMQPGMISDPIRTVNGFYIIQVRSMQTGTGADPMRDQYSLMLVRLPLTPDADPAAVSRRAREAQEFRSQVASCESAPALIRKYLSGTSEAPRQVLAGNLDPRTRQALANVAVGKATEPIRSEAGVEMLVVCGHKPAQGEIPTREQIDNSLYEQQLSMMGRRHLRDLRRDAVVVYR
ncbi:MAG: peptidylprolyl isomerase [Parvibaculum sp.]|uniref:peptidylprolyl isomerase n=1 Tax=Parvibaculum sp. TaxID=2024848 RepID=UPI0034A065AA